MKDKGEKERYIHLNAEFQRRARRDKKGFLNDQCKEIEENNRMAKTRDLFKEIRDTKETFHTKMGTITDRNGMDLTDAEILRRGVKSTQNAKARVAQSCPTFCDPIDYTVHAILQARTLEWVAVPFSRGSS